MIRKVFKNQVHDPQRGSFYVNLSANGERYAGLPVYADAFGNKIVIVDAER